MKSVFFLYDHFSGFETMTSAFQLHDGLISAALEDRIYVSEENMQFKPHTTLDQINPEEVDLFFIPGGDPRPLFERKDLRTFLTRVYETGGHLAAICGGPALLAYFGFLDGKRCTGGGDGVRPEHADFFPLYAKAQLIDEGVVTDRRITTAKGQFYAELSLILNKELGLYETEEEQEQDWNWWINQKRD